MEKDLKLQLNRRSILKALGVAVPAAGLLVGCSDDSAVATPDAGVDGAGATPDMGAPAADMGFSDGTAAADLAAPDMTGKACAPTKGDALGPFHEKGAPFRAMLAGATEPGDRVIVSGTVFGPDCKTPLAGAIVDVWHADASGKYHSGTKDYRLRGQMKTDAKGRYQFESVWPGHYDKRPRHYHFIVSMPGHAPLTTQCYFVGDPYLGPKDSCQKPTCDSSDPERILALGSKSEGGKTYKTAMFDVTLKKA